MLQDAEIIIYNGLGQRNKAFGKRTDKNKGRTGKYLGSGLLYFSGSQQPVYTTKTINKKVIR